MKGYVQMAAIDFDTWNNAATVKANEKGKQCEPYTYCISDINPAYVWARVEDDYITNEPLLSEQEAINLGMINDAGIN